MAGVTRKDRIKAKNVELERLRARVKELEQELKESDEATTDQAKTSMKLIWGMEILGIPDSGSENYEAAIIYAAFRLGLLKRKPGLLTTVLKDS